MSNVCLTVQARPVIDCMTIKVGHFLHPPSETLNKQLSKQGAANSNQAIQQLKPTLLYKMAAAPMKFTIAATLFCVAMLWHGSLQMPIQTRTRRSICASKLKSPTVERDLLLGLRTMYFGIFFNTMSVSNII